MWSLDPWSYILKWIGVWSTAQKTQVCMNKKIATDKERFFIRKMLISFLFLDENICYGYSLEAPRWGASNEYPQHMFLSRNKKNIMWIPLLICSYVRTPNSYLQITYFLFNLKLLLFFLISAWKCMLWVLIIIDLQLKSGLFLKLCISLSILYTWPKFAEIYGQQQAKKLLQMCLKCAD